MWLLNAHTYELESFESEEVPAYAILSHRWEDNEPTFSDVKEGRQRTKKGWKKVEMCCRQALHAQLDYVWADTCCIDKKSSAELSEAINSMFRLYQNADTCYAYLSDISDDDAVTNSVWFSRGWTLQELLAPRWLIFFSNDWTNRGSKLDLQREIHEHTGIPEDALSAFDPADAKAFCIAQKMSWAATRRTTRVEDRAYSLLGLFDVNMPLLYGEGRKAFTRLQQELMKISDDLSLFAWDGLSDPIFGTLAALPDSFANLAAFKGISAKYTVTKHHITVACDLWHHQMDVYLATVGYTSNDPSRCVIYLKLVRADSQIPTFRRIMIDGRPKTKVPWYLGSFRQDYSRILLHVLQEPVENVRAADNFHIPEAQELGGFQVGMLKYDRGSVFNEPAAFVLRLYGVSCSLRQGLLGQQRGIESDYREPCLYINHDSFIHFGINALDGLPTVLLSPGANILKKRVFVASNVENMLVTDVGVNNVAPFSVGDPVKVIEIRGLGSFSFYASNNAEFNHGIDPPASEVFIVVIRLAPGWQDTSLIQVNKLKKRGRLDGTRPVKRIKTLAEVQMLVP